MNFIKASYLRGKIAFGDNFTINLSKEDVKKHDDFYKKLEEEYKEKLASRLEEIEKLNSDPKAKNKVNPEEDKAVHGYKNNVARIEEILENGIHDVVFGIRPEDIYPEEDPSKENPSSPITLVCDMSELLGHDRIIYTELNDKERIIIKVNAKWAIKSGDENKYVLNVGRINIFDPETTRSILCYYTEEK